MRRSGGTKFNMFIKKKVGFLFLLLSLSLSSSAAQEKKPCLIFSGNKSYEYAVDLMMYNRISFGDDSMTLTDKGDNRTSLEVLYSAYNRFKVGEAEPSGVDNIQTDHVEIHYDKSTQSLVISSAPSDHIIVGVYNLGGTLVLRGEINNNNSISVKSLASGVYVAIAIGSHHSQYLKFIK